ncbi:MAG: nucleotidyltransferase domain-containing protein [Synergistaceae bacterium]|nr:nucleotidyltransferase domain-containing protein [Synergistaceae bacterium]
MQILLDLDIRMNSITQKTLDLFVERVKKHEGDNLSRIILFGSVARGEANIDSDIDVLFILKECSFEKKREICYISADVEKDMNFDENAYLQALTMSEEESKGLDYYGLMINVNREGVVLYDSQR